MTERDCLVRAAAGALALALAAGPAHAAGLYKCKTLGGRIVISDRPCTQEALGKDLKLATPPPVAAQPPERSPNSFGKPEGRPVAAAAPEAEAPEELAAPPTREVPSGIKREEQAEQQSEGN